MFKIMYSNRFETLMVEDPTDYKDYEDVAPYNKLKDEKWTSLWMNRHPLVYMIHERFSDNYIGKLLWRELEEIREEIEKFRRDLRESRKKIWSRKQELDSLIREQKKLCSEDTRVSTVNTILISAIDVANNTFLDSQSHLAAFFQQVPEAIMMMDDIISFLPIETCAQKLERHLDKCTGFDGTGKYKCTENFVCYDCDNSDKIAENGRCSHYYEIKSANEELEMEEYNYILSNGSIYEYQDEDRIEDLEYKYRRALAVKENRLEEFVEAIYDSY